MIEIIHALPKGIFGIELRDCSTDDEFDDIMNVFDSTISESYDLTLLIDIHPSFKSPDVFVRHRFENWLSARGRVQRFALVAQQCWLIKFEEFVNFIGCEFKMFEPGRREKAVNWLIQAPLVDNLR